MVEKLRLMFDFTNKIKNSERNLNCDNLTAYFVSVLFTNSWIHQLLARELLDPFYLLILLMSHWFIIIIGDHMINALICDLLKPRYFVLGNVLVVNRHILT